MAKTTQQLRLEIDRCQCCVTRCRAHSQVKYQRLGVYDVHHRLTANNAPRKDLLKAYGTAVIVFAYRVSQVVVRCVAIRRLSTYMKSKEAFSYVSMLVASHDNAMDGSLFVGDCGIMDTLFNKPMSAVPENKAVHWATSWFQTWMAAITFVAAQQGWDGVWCSFLVALVGVQWVVHSTPRGPSLVRGWPDGEEFGGRFAVLGAIQGFTGSNVHDEMLAFSTLVTRDGLIDNNVRQYWHLPRC
ncbi:uncharacterized protein G6M90_00g044860 [Metarhizium brunneum]|uniref:Uncharacterized protein n=1 Tax=Metarhizium brunneum TaxID=500148 RepID=A0A7D5Z776_9HYPO|nr:hypothetical protein G6M90_00g044860 [Metarhizium brunneum]